MENKRYCVISHTHWDREWYLPFEEHRFHLVELINELLKILEREPSYVFHLDAQTVVLEDYLEVYPGKRELLQKYIQAGNILVGPWYLQNDFYLTSGEATIRNLQIGTKLAKEFGNCSTVGYCPDQFGDISQLPQIFKNFGIDSFLSARGYTNMRKDLPLGKTVPNASEFIWQGADGSQVLGVFMPGFYNNAQRFSADLEKSMRYLKFIDNQLSPVAQTSNLLLMNGVDHLEPQGNLLPILSKLNEKLENGATIRQMSMREYMDLVKAEVKDKNIQLSVISGEQRYGLEYEILNGTLSSRPYLKVLNERAQTDLQQMLEPLYATMEMQGFNGIYSNEEFDFMWKKLIKNHPHDSICGCSRNEVHSDMEKRYEHLKQVTDMQFERAMKTACSHMEIDGENCYVAIVYNPTAFPQSGVCDVDVDILAEENVMDFDLFSNGQKVDYKIIRTKDLVRDIVTPVNLPGLVKIHRHTLRFYAKDVAPYGFQFYRVQPKEFEFRPYSMNTIFDCIENEALKVEVDGANIRLTDKTTGNVFENFLFFDDKADIGNMYIYLEPDNHNNYIRKGSDRVCSTKHMIPRIEITENDDFTQEMCLRYTLEVPQTYDFKNKCRSNETVEETITLRLRLNRGEAFLRASYTIDNKAKFHRMRMLFNHGIVKEETFASSPFDVIVRSRKSLHPQANNILPNSGLFGIEGEKKALAVFTKGNMDYEPLANQGMLATTVLRCNEAINNLEADGTVAGTNFYATEGQLLRQISGDLAVMPYAAGTKTNNQLINLSDWFKAGFGTFAFSTDPLKFGTGRPGVQDSTLTEVFFKEDPYPQTKIVPNSSVLQIKGDVSVSAFKKSLGGNGYILRLWNANEAQTSATIEIEDSSYRLLETNMAEESGQAVDNTVVLGAKEIKTFRIAK